MLEDLVGKQILKIYCDYSCDIIIRFTDDTIVKLHAAHTYYDNIEFQLEFNKEKLSDYELFHIGLMTEEQLKQKQDAQRREDERQVLAREKAYYEQLKRKFK